MRASTRWGRTALLLVALLGVTLATIPLLGAASTTPPAPPQAVASSSGPTPSPMDGHPWSCHGSRLIGTRACAGEAAAEGAMAPGPLTAPGWTLANTTPPPFSVYDFEMTYDAADGYVLLLGSTMGAGGTLGPTEMWTFANQTWAPLHPAVLPDNCPGSLVAYDSTDGYVVYFGGPLPYSSTCGSSGETWTYLHGVWTQRAPSVSPPVQYGASLSDDPADGVVLLFGGAGGPNASCPTTYPIGGYCNDTWAFAAGNWNELTPTTSPSNRAEAGLAYDAADGYVLLFGGTNASGALNDTWKYSGGTWTRLHPATSPSVPTPDAFSYDSTDGVIVYTTAENFSGPLQEITWTYSAGNWTQITSPGPVERLGAGAADDPTDRGMLFFGGAGYTPLVDSWIFHAGAWTNVTRAPPSARFDAAAAYDGATGSYVLFSGAQAPNDTWTYTGAGWSQLAPNRTPPARALGNLVYDAADGYLLLFGGYGASGPLNDTWEFAAGTWSLITPTTAPPAGPGFYASMVYDGADGYVLLLVGAPGHMWTWTYRAGTWSNITGTAGTPPPGPAASPLAYDSSDGYVLLFGTSQPALTNETWSFFGGHWTNLTAAIGRSPPATSSAALVDFPPGGYVLLYQGTGTNDTWSYENGTWTPLFAPDGPSSVVAMAGAYDPSLSADVLFGGLSTACGSSNSCDATWLWSLNGAVGPFVRSYSIRPSTTDVGVAVNLTADVVGGIAPLTYAYTGLPSGCLTANSSRLTCVPTAPGSYRILVIVSDSGGHVATAAGDLTVNPALAATSLTVAPSSVTVGTLLDFFTAISGGTAPYSYVYHGLPPGCSSQTVPVLPCVPTTAGSYIVVVTVTDAVGQSASFTLGFDVSPAGASGGPQVYSFGAVPSSIVLGNATNLSLTASGGTPPYTVAYSGLPAGCASRNVTQLLCRPILAGTWTISGTVTDQRGNSTTVQTNLTVFPVGGGAGLYVTAFGASPSTFVVGNSTVLAVVASGGIGPLGYAYSGLPPGCVEANVSVLGCQPTAPGRFTVSATAFDSAGHRAGVLALLDVLPTSIGPAPAISRFLLSPSTVVAGNPITAVVSVAGGLLPLTYQYAGLPSGCYSTNSSVLSCTPVAAGRFTLTVEVTDSASRSTNATAALTVLPAPTNPSGPTGLSGSLLESPYVVAGLFLTGLVAAAGIAFLLDRGRRRRQEGRRLVAELDSAPLDASSDDQGD